ncbi:MAG: hypothetical protein OXG34_01720 [bacterium]|nr:hypothetical protein [bacterium]MCY3890897.1 hypothetical protein [bacterium]MCY3960373.1 hypothetical protein [bacterium]
MEQLTVRGFGDDLGAAVRRLAARERISLNQAALRLLRRGAGLSDRAEQADAVGASLDHLIGNWTTAEADELDAALADFETIDEDTWA